MRAAVVLLALVAGAAQAADISTVPSGRYLSDAGHRFITFSYSHLGMSRPEARVTDFEATLDLDASRPENSKVVVVVKAAGINSGIPAMDQQFHGDTLFDVSRHPDIRFVSTSMSRLSAEAGTMTGDLTIKGVTKPVTLDVKLNGAGAHPMTKKPALGFSASGTVKRSDWGLLRSIPAVGDEVALSIEIEFLSAAP